MLVVFVDCAKRGGRCQPVAQEYLYTVMVFKTIPATRIISIAISVLLCLFWAALDFRVRMLQALASSVSSGLAVLAERPPGDRLGKMTLLSFCGARRTPATIE